MDITDQIRSACAEVAQGAKFVRINANAIDAYARSLPLERVQSPQLDPKVHCITDEAGTVAFFLALDSINFGSGYFPQLRKREGMSGYYTIASSLKEYCDANGPMPPGKLATIPPGECRKIFNQDARNAAAMNLMALFSSAWNDLGRLLISEYGGQFTRLVEAAGHSAVRLIQILARMPFFRDVHRWRDIEVPFYKRAQIASADLSMALNGRGLGHFTDLHRLTIFADNLVPHVLRIDGILAYEPALAQRIDREELLTLGSEEEVEIRACAVHAVELMRAALSQRGQSVTSAKLDCFLWNRGQEKHYKTIKPRHRARGVFY